MDSLHCESTREKRRENGVMSVNSFRAEFVEKHQVPESALVRVKSLSHSRLTAADGLSRQGAIRSEGERSNGSEKERFGARLS